MQNNDIARRFDEVAKLLNEQNDNPYRVQAYRRAAQTLRQLDLPVSEIARAEGEAGLRKLPGIGESLARAIVEMLLTGRLPNTSRGNRHYTALFSNTARAHQTGNTRDWVVLYYDDGKEEQQATVMTCTRGPLKGRRVVRGREGEGRRVTPEPSVSFQSEA